MNKFFHEFEDAVFKEKLGKLPPKRGPLGEAVIEIQPGKVPIKQRAFQLVGERREALNTIIASLVEEGKVEKGVSPWCSPDFPVFKRKGEHTGWLWTFACSMMRWSQMHFLHQGLMKY